MPLAYGVLCALNNRRCLPLRGQHGLQLFPFNLGAIQTQH